MRLSSFMEGVNILSRYFYRDGHHIGAEHDQFFVSATNGPVGSDDLRRLLELGWFQPEAAGGNDPEGYDPDQGWSAFI